MLYFISTKAFFVEPGPSMGTDFAVYLVLTTM